MQKLIVIFTLIIAIGSAKASYATQITNCVSEQCHYYFDKFSLSAKRGHPVAMATLAQFYYFGYGTEKNEALAVKYFKKSARLGNLAAHYKLGLIYLNSEQFKDVDKGLEHLRKASLKNYKNATFIVGVVYLSQKYQHQDLDLSDQFLTRAYKQKHHDIPSVIDYINTSMVISSSTFPLLHEAMLNSPLVKNHNDRSAWPHDNTEVISVISPPIESIFDSLLISFRNQRPATGSRFKGKTCNQNVSCLNIDDFQDAVDWLRML